jgi:hypothetical protein
MREIRTSGSMSGEGKRDDGQCAPSYRAPPRLYQNRMTRCIRVGNRARAIPAFAGTSLAHADARARLPTLRVNR